MDDYMETKLQNWVEQTDRDVTLDEAHEALEEKIEEFENRALENVDEQTKVDYALSMLSSEDLRDRRVGASGTLTDIDVLAIGHRGVVPDWGDDDVDTVLAHGVIKGRLPDENGEKGDERIGKAILFLRKSEVDLLNAQKEFSIGETFSTEFEVETGYDLPSMYRCYSAESTSLEPCDVDGLPDDREERNEELRRMFPDTDLADLAENGDGLSAYDPDTDGNYTHDWGVDVKRITGTIVDHYIPDDRSWGRYTLMDPSVTGDDIEGTDLVGDNQNVPGLTVFCQPDYHMDYGVESICDFYGVVEVRDNGQIQMNAVGIAPISPTPLDDDEQSETDVEATETSI